MGSTLPSLAVTLAVQMLASMTMLAVPVLAPEASRDLGVAASWVGLYISIAYGASMVSSVSCGDVIRRLGAIRVSQFCLLACALAALLAAGATLPLFVASAVVMGLGYGPVTPASSHVLARTTAPEAMSLVFSLKQTGVPLGGVAAGVVVPVLTLGMGWRPALLMVAAACVLVAAAAQSIRAELDADREPGRRIGAGSMAGPMRVILGAPDLRRLTLMSFFFSGTQLCLVTYLVTYLSSLGYGLVQAGLMLSVAQAAGVVGRIGWGALADRLRRPVIVLALLALGMTLGTFGTAAFDAHWPAFGITAVCAIFGATAIGWNGVFLAEVARRAPEGHAVEATGGALFVTYSGVLIAPPVFAFALEQGASFALAYAALGLPALASAARLWWWDRALQLQEPA